MTSFCNWRAPVPLSSHIHTRISARIYCPRIRKPWGQKKIFSIIPHILTAQLVKNPSAIQETPSSILGLGRSSGEGIGYPFQYSWASFVAQMVKNPPAMQQIWVPWLGRSLGGWHGNPFQYSCLENPYGQRSLEGYSP